MSYLVFARKFRPQRFKDLIGQEAIVATLQNAIKEGRMAQSFLFSGTRGVGKTSTARILAKALNCETGTVPEPCGDCVPCREIPEGTSLDVLEIDGASNRGIEEIRNLRDNVKFKPAACRFKIYIIDEVHMLTQEAFNALLKTLEEPPGHVKFIFATTEIHKVPSTILSRCQKFVFRRVPAASMAAKLREIAEMEKISCDDKSLFAIAKAADGSLRDAESLLDQMASFAKGRITHEQVIEAFGLATDETYLALLDAILAKEPKRVLEIFAPLQSEGRDMLVFVRGLLEVFRALLILKVTGGSSGLIDLSGEAVAELKLRQEKFSKEDLLAILQLLQNLMARVRRSSLPHFDAETTLVQLAVREDLISLAEMIAKLDWLAGLKTESSSPLDKGPKLSAHGPVRKAFPEIPPAGRGFATGLASNGKMNLGSGEPAGNSSSASPVSTALGTPALAGGTDAVPVLMPSQGESIRAGGGDAEPKGVALPKSIERSRGLQAFSNPRSVFQRRGFAAPAGGPLTAEGILTLNEVEKVWPEVLERTRTRKISCGTYLSEAEPIEVDGSLVALGLPAEFKFHKESLETPENRKIVEEVIQSVLGASVRVSFVITVPEKASLAKAGPAGDEEKVPEIVESAIKMFDGKIVSRK